MAIVLTNGKYYIRLGENERIEKTCNIEEAEIFPSLNKAVKVIRKAQKKTENYYVFDTETKQVCWKNYKRRKQYSQETRKMIYHKAAGHCQLCGREIAYEEATMDHVIPLVVGGIDSVDNLQLSCRACNLFKGNILPAKFFDRITEIFMYQMEKKYGNREEWKTARNLLMEIL